MCSLDQLYEKVCITKRDIILPPLVFWTCNISWDNPGTSQWWHANNESVLQTLKRKLTIVVSVKQVLRQSGQPLGAVFGLFLTAAVNAVRVRLSGSRWVKGAVKGFDSWPRPPARQAWTHTWIAQGWKNKVYLFKRFSKISLIHYSHKKEINILYIFNAP